MSKFIIRTIIVFVLSFGILNFVQAQDDPPDNGDPGQDPDLIPLDPGTWVLVAAGVGYGIKKLRDARRDSTAKFTSDDKTDEFK